MTTKLTKLILSIFICIASLGIFIPATPVFAYDPCKDTNLPAEVKAANGCNASENNDELASTIQGIINGVIGILASVAVIFVLVGGVQYMTSGGDSGKVKTAKNTIIYALIGLVICVLAFAIVNWLIGVLKAS